MRSPSDFAEDAACRSADPDIFFPSSGHPDSPAKKICETCDVTEECLEWALANSVAADGVWGGKSQSERRRIVREQRRRRRRSNASREGGAAAS